MLSISVSAHAQMSVRVNVFSSEPMGVSKPPVSAGITRAGIFSPECVVAGAFLSNGIVIPYVPLRIASCQYACPVSTTSSSPDCRTRHPPHDGGIGHGHQQIVSFDVRKVRAVADAIAEASFREILPRRQQRGAVAIDDPRLLHEQRPAGVQRFNPRALRAGIDRGSALRQLPWRRAGIVAREHHRASNKHPE